MLNARQQVGDALSTVCDNTKMTRPEGDVELPMICYAESGNAPVNIAYDRIKWRVAVYASTFSELVDLVSKADSIMTHTLGYTRTDKSSDESARVGPDLYLCRLDYVGVVNTRTKTIVKNAT